MGNVLVAAVGALHVPHLQQNSAWMLFFSFLKRGVFTDGRQSRWWEESGEGPGRSNVMTRKGGASGFCPGVCSGGVVRRVLLHLR